MRNRKYEICKFSFYDLTGMQTHLENMALHGWFIDRISNYTWMYRRGTPKKLHYCVSYYLKASIYEPEPCDGQQEFQELCEHTGWSLAAQNGKMLILCNEYENPIPVHTDPKDEVEAIQKISSSWIGQYVMCLMLALLYSGSLWINLRAHPVQTLSNGVVLAATGIMCVGVIFQIMDMVFYIWWLIRAKKAADMGEFVETPSGIHRAFLPVLYLLLTVYAALLVYRTQYSMKKYTLAMLFIILGGVVLVTKTREMLKKKKVAAERNMMITVLLTIVYSAIAVSAVGYVLLGTGTANQPNANELAITGAELTGADEKEYETAIDRRESILVTRTIVRQTTAEGSKGTKLTYHIVDVNIKSIMKICTEDYLHRYDGTVWASDLEYQADDPSQWNACAAWKLYNPDNKEMHYLIQYSNRIVELITDIKLTDNQIRICAERIQPEIK